MIGSSVSNRKAGISNAGCPTYLRQRSWTTGDLQNWVGDIVPTRRRSSAYRCEKQRNVVRLEHSQRFAWLCLGTASAFRTLGPIPGKGGRAKAPARTTPRGCHALIGRGQQRLGQQEATTPPCGHTPIRKDPENVCFFVPGPHGGKGLPQPCGSGGSVHGE